MPEVEGTCMTRFVTWPIENANVEQYKLGIICSVCQKFDFGNEMRT